MRICGRVGKDIWYERLQSCSFCIVGLHITILSKGPYPHTDLWRIGVRLAASEL